MRNQVQKKVPVNRLVQADYRPHSLDVELSRRAVIMQYPFHRSVVVDITPLPLADPLA